MPKVTVQVDINSAGNLRANLAELAKDIQRIQNTPGFFGNARAIQEAIRDQRLAVQGGIQMQGLVAKGMQSPEFMNLLREQVRLGREQNKNLVEARRLSLIAQHGPIMGRVRGLAEAAGIDLGNYGPAAIAAAMTAAMAAASPDTFSTFRQSGQLASGAIGQNFIGLFATVSQGLQQFGRDIHGGLGHALRNWFWFRDPAEDRNLALQLGMTNFQPQQIPIENLHDIIQAEAVRTPLDQEIFDLQRESFQQLVENTGESSWIARLLPTILSGGIIPPG